MASLLATSGKVSVRVFSPPSVSCRNKKHGFVKICRSLQSHWFELLSLHHGTTVGRVIKLQRAECIDDDITYAKEHSDFIAVPLCSCTWRNIEKVTGSQDDEVQEKDGGRYEGR